MSFENEKSKNPTTPETIQAEELALLDIQAMHTATLNSLGITEKAEAGLRKGDAAKLTGLSRPVIAVTQRKEEDGAITRVFNVRFETPGAKSTSYVYAPVAELTGNSLGLESDCTLPQAEAVIAMAEELENSGLPHLSSDLGGIHNPFTAITKLPPQALTPPTPQ